MKLKLSTKRNKIIFRFSNDWRKKSHNHIYEKFRKLKGKKKPGKLTMKLIYLKPKWLGWWGEKKRENILGRLHWERVTGKAMVMVNSHMRPMG